MKTIRSSMLPSWDDCARRAGGRQYASLLSEKNFTLRDLPDSAGAAIGSAVHAGAEHLLTARLEKRDKLSFAECLLWAMRTFEEKTARGVIWDATTKNILDGRRQIEKMLRVYLQHISNTQPLIVEDVLEGTLDGDWLLSGHMDLYSADLTLSDLKTGAKARPCKPQIGSYCILIEANGFPRPKKAEMNFVKRVGVTKPQPPVETTVYDVSECMDLAWRAIREIKSCVEQFEATGDPLSFRANGYSQMCTPKYCHAWGTDFCTSHAEKKEDG